MDYPSVVEELFSNALYRMNKIIKIRKEALHFYSNSGNGRAVSGENSLLEEEKTTLTPVEYRHKSPSFEEPPLSQEFISSAASGPVR